MKRINRSAPDDAQRRSSRREVTRRRAIAALAVGVCVASIPVATARSQQPEVPAFSSGPYQFRELLPRRELPSIILFGLAGGAMNLASLKGNPIILNFWATWCAACRTELPILDRLQERLGDTGLHVLAVSQDRGERPAIDRYVKALKLRSLSLFWDPHGDVAFADRSNRRKAPFALYGMPISYAIARSGRIVGYMPGAADWNSDSARKLLRHLDRF
jgi:thiol-disulfide isomerase/thioredoxin